MYCEKTVIWLFPQKIPEFSNKKITMNYQNYREVVGRKKAGQVLRCWGSPSVSFADSSACVNPSAVVAAFPYQRKALKHNGTSGMPYPTRPVYSWAGQGFFRCAKITDQLQE